MDEMEIVRRLYHLFYVMRKEALQMPEHHIHKSIGGRDLMMLDSILGLNKDGNLVKMSEISTYFQITPAAISQIVRSYEEKGWIERVVLKNDRRSVYIEVSDKAKRLLQEHEELMTARLLDFITYLGEEDAKALVRIIEKSTAYAKKMKEEKHCKEGDRAC